MGPARAETRGPGAAEAGVAVGTSAGVRAEEEEGGWDGAGAVGC